MKRILIIGITALLVLTTIQAVFADSAEEFPEIIPLPDGFNPEGIASGDGSTFYVGSLAGGAIFQGDFKTGVGEVLVPPQDRVSVGLAFDKRTKWIFAAGGPTGAGHVYDGRTGGNVASFQFASSPTFINDVVVTKDGAYFTDSFNPVLYKVPLNRNGSLVENADFEVIPLGGDFAFVPGAFNTNGIDALPNGKWLIIVQTNPGVLYRVHPKTGAAKLLDLGGASVPNGDGILLDGKRLYVVQNFLNQISVIRLKPGLTSGVVEKVITSPNFRIPTTVDEFGDFLYAVNARFDTPPTPTTEYELVRVAK